MRRTTASAIVAIARRRDKEGPSQGTLGLSACAPADLCAHGIAPRARGRGPGVDLRAGDYFLAAILAEANSLMIAASVSGWSFITQ